VQIHGHRIHSPTPPSSPPIHRPSCWPPLAFARAGAHRPPSLADPPTAGLNLEVLATDCILLVLAPDLKPEPEPKMRSTAVPPSVLMRRSLGRSNTQSSLVLVSLRQRHLCQPSWRGRSTLPMHTLPYHPLASQIEATLFVVSFVCLRVVALCSPIIRAIPCPLKLPFPAIVHAGRGTCLHLPSRQPSSTPLRSVHIVFDYAAPLNTFSKNPAVALLPVPPALLALRPAFPLPLILLSLLVRRSRVLSPSLLPPYEKRSPAQHSIAQHRLSFHHQSSRLLFMSRE